MSMGLAESSMHREKEAGSIRAEIIQGRVAVQAWDGVTAWGISPMGSGSQVLPPRRSAMADELT
jgi:hypothetical protein